MPKFDIMPDVAAKMTEEELDQLRAEYRLESRLEMEREHERLLLAVGGACTWFVDPFPVLHRDTLERTRNYLARIPYQDFLRTEFWRIIREEVKRRSGYKCRLCASGGTLHVHHSAYHRRGYEDFHLEEDVVLLCGDCHGRFHRKCL